MGTVSVNTPKTPATAGSNGLALATLPNVCKMPGPPAPFVPTPLPNVGNTNSDTKGYSKSVKFDGHDVAIRGASFGSTGDIASKATGGGIVSQNTHGPTRFIGPGSLNVKVEGNTKLQGPAAKATFKREWSRVNEIRSQLKCSGAGFCAGQRLLTYAGHQPVAMTEAWFAPHKDAPRVAIFRVRDGVSLPEQGHGELVPSCGACQILLPFALCDKRPTC